ncbi:MAG: hypothetical protein R2739_08860 [Chitinophagales bacterium]|nr:hypothetical protein [Bacteroidota bacterium]
MQIEFKYKLPYRNLLPFLVFIAIALLLVGGGYLMNDFDTTNLPSNSGKMGRGTSRNAVIDIGSLIAIVLFITLLVNVVKIFLSGLNPNKISFEEEYFIIPKGRNAVRKIDYADIKRPVERQIHYSLLLIPKKSEFNRFRIYLKGFNTDEDYYSFEKTLQEYVEKLPEVKPKQIWE